MSMFYFRQLMLTSELFSADEVSKYLLPLSITLAEDKVSEVRQMAFRLVIMFLRYLWSNELNLIKFTRVNTLQLKLRFKQLKTKRYTCTSIVT